MKWFILPRIFTNWFRDIIKEKCAVKGGIRLEEPKTHGPMIVSNIPGRVRYKICQLYKNPLLAESLTDLIALPGVLRVEANIYSATLLIVFDPTQIGEPAFRNPLAELVQNSLVYEVQTEVYGKVASTLDSALASRNATPEENPSEINEHWHQMPLPQIINLLNTNLKEGLSNGQAETILAQVGPNEFESKKNKSLLTLFFCQFDSFLIKLLVGAGLVSIFLGQLVDALSILAIVALEAILGVWQNYKAEKSLEALRQYSSAQAKILRDGTIQQIPTREIVPGDILFLEAGNIIPADARLIESANLEINEAALTGESVPVEKSHKINYTSRVPLADRKNMLYMGTTVVKGTAKALVVQTGGNTELGSIAKMVDECAAKLTPLQKDLNHLSRVISYGCLGICGAILLSGVIGGQPFTQMLRTGLSLAIGAIPEGLTSVLTVSLAFGVQRMAKKGAIVKELPATEVLSCADVICTDKTGTLTTGQMTVTNIYTLARNYRVTGAGYSARGHFFLNFQDLNPQENADLKKILTIGALCNNTSYTRTLNRLEILGDPTEGALWVLAAKANLHIEDFACYKREKEIAFDSDRKRMTVICKGPDGAYSVNVKGDPSVVLQSCSNVFDGQSIKSLTPEHIAMINNAVEDMAERSLRVIGLAYKEATEDPGDDPAVETDLIFAGLVGMMDPPRSEVKAAIKKCQKAGIKIIMITGDHRKTAEAIGRQIHLLDDGGEVITGEELDSLTDDELLARIDNIAIFARTTPRQKLRLVKLLKKKGHTVVMTGDGVNDAPAIREASIGIAMGKNGTDVTRESSSIILTDDNFTTILNAIEEGRGISSNIKKFMRFVLSGNIGEVVAIFIASILGLPTPLMPGQILMVNLITEGIPALSLGVDAPERNTLDGPPRDARKSIMDENVLGQTLSRGMMIGLSTLSLFTGTYLATDDVIKSRTLAYANLVANQMFHVFDCRNASLSENKYIIPAVLTSSLILLGSIYIPSFCGIFGTCQMGVVDWLAVLFMSAFIGRLDYIKERATQLVCEQLTDDDNSLRRPGEPAKMRRFAPVGV